MKLSPHLSLSELACKDAARTPYPAQWIEGRAKPLAVVFEGIRRHVGAGPIVINSAYRTPAHNKAVGGAAYSQHLEGRALDLRCPAGMVFDLFAERVLEAARLINALAEADPRLTKVGFVQTYPRHRFVHVDTRENDDLRVVRG